MLTDAGAAGAAPALAADVLRGLTASPKRLSCTFLYDDEGSRLFEAICDRPEYYLTRAEREILARHARELVPIGRAPIDLIELGSGSAQKTRLVIDALLGVGVRVRYLPIDVSRAMLEASSRALLAGREGLEVVPLVAEYDEGLRAALMQGGGRPRLVLWLGSSLGNFEPVDAAAFLGRVREQLSARDRLLVGVDLRKDRATLERAYDDAAGVTARFNLNLLRRINRELGGRFDLARFRHRAVYDAAKGRVAMLLVSLGAQRVPVARLGIEVVLADGEAILTENSYKYAPAEIDALVATAGLSVARRWLDRARRYSLNLLAPTLQ